MSSRFSLALISLLALGGCSKPSEPMPAAMPQTSAVEHASMPSVGPVTPPTTDADMIKSAMSAAPEAVSSAATIIAMDDKMQMRTLREGTNGWTCMPDGPSPGVDPMCLDKNATAWAMAWMARKDPPRDKMGFGYMLMGGSDASNTDPFAMEPNPGDRWVDTGPHVMVLNIGNKFEGYPTTPANPKAPYVMYPNTAYAHLMMPVK